MDPRYKKCTCKICRKEFISRKKKYTCENCKVLDDAYFTRVEEYLKKFPNSSAVQIAESLNMSVEIIVGYMCEGRLSYSKGYFEKLQ